MPRHNENQLLPYLRQKVGEIMKVNVGESLYEMGDKQFKGVLKIASQAIPFGIYAIRKKSIAIFLKETHSTHEELKKAVSGYAMKGFKVYYNEHGRSN